MLEKFDRKYVGACVDTNNSYALLEHPGAMMPAAGPQMRDCILILDRNRAATYNPATKQLRSLWQACRLGLDEWGLTELTGEIVLVS